MRTALQASASLLSVLLLGGCLTSHFFRLDITRTEVDREVRILRSQLDPVDGVLKPFSVATAHRLYESLLKRAEAALVGVTHAIVVADGALQSLPFGVLVTRRPVDAAVNGPDYRDVAWLARRFAITVLPSESSLKSLRRFDRGKPGSEPSAALETLSSRASAGTAASRRASYSHAADPLTWKR